MSPRFFFNDYRCVFRNRMLPNGPAIWGGCVTRRSTGQGPGTPPQAGPQNCHGARRVWHVFLPSWYKFYCVLARSRYNFDVVANLSPVTNLWRALAQCRGTNCLGARNLSWCRIFIACRCACPGTRIIKNLSRMQEQKQKP